MKLSNIVRITWVALCVVLLGISMYHYDLPENKDNAIALTWFMLALSFPSGIVWLFALAPINFLILDRFSVTNGYLNFFVIWVGFFASSYVQWFVLLPKLRKKLRERGRSSPEVPSP
jgi:ABC-type multidrug transport system permease subunit